MPQKNLDHFCDSCTWWQFRFNNYENRFGLCTNPFITDMIRVTQLDPDEDEAEIFTHALFGCNEHEAKELVVVEIKPEIK